jgi:hypothetical protein
MRQLHRNLTGPGPRLHQSRLFILTPLGVVEKERWQLLLVELLIRIPHQHQIRRFPRISSRFRLQIRCQEPVSLEIPITRTSLSI